MELLELYDDLGNPTGKTMVRGDKRKLEENEHIAVTVIFLKNKEGKFLIQKTSEKKGGKYASTGGHITKGETPLETIIREVKEELGVSLQKEEIKSLGFVLFDTVIRFLFYTEKEVDPKDLTLQKEEVENVEYKTVEEIEELSKAGKMLESHKILLDELLKKI